MWLVHTYDLLEGRRIDDVIAILFLNYIRQADFMLSLTFCTDVFWSRHAIFPANNARVEARLRERPRSVCSVCQNVARTSVTHSAIVSCATFLFLLHSDGICDPLLIDARQNQTICQATYLHNEGSLLFASNADWNSSQQVIMSSRSFPLHSTKSRTTGLMLDGW